MCVPNRTSEDGDPILNLPYDMCVEESHSIFRPSIDFDEMLDEELCINATTSLIHGIRTRLLQLADECNEDDLEGAIAYR